MDHENVASTWPLNLRNLEHRFVHTDMDDISTLWMSRMSLLPSCSTQAP